MLLAFFGVSLVIGFGVLVVELVRPSSTWIERLALGYLLGIGLFTNAQFLANLIGVPYSLGGGLAVLFAVTAPLVVAVSRQRKNAVPQLIRRLGQTPRVGGLSVLERSLAAGIAFLVGVTLISGLFWPVKDWDSIVLYDFRAKVFVQTGFMDEGIRLEYFFGYPLLTSLAHAWIYVWGYPYPGMMHSFFYAALLALMYATVRRRTSRVWALGWTLILGLSAALFDHALMTYTNLAYTVYLVTGYFFLTNWVEKGSRRDMLTSALLVGLSTWTRSAEPFWAIILLGAFAVGGWRKQRSAWLLYPLIILGLRQPWQMFEKQHSKAPSSLLHDTVLVGQRFVERLTIANVVDVLKYYWQNVVAPSGALYIVFLLTTFLLLMRARKKNVLVANVALCFLILLNIAVVLMGIYYFSLFYREWREVGGSAQRMSLFFGPLIVFYSSLVSYQLFAPQRGPAKSPAKHVVSLPAKRRRGRR